MNNTASSNNTPAPETLNTTSTPPTWLERDIAKVKPQPSHPLTAVETEPSSQCSSCHTVITNTALNFNSYVCPHCDHHLTMTARDRLNWFFDSIEQELGQEFNSTDPLGFVDSKPYPTRLQQAQDKTEETEALVSMIGQLKNLQLVACAFDFRFMGGSMGSVVGDRFVQAGELALDKGIPLVCFAASGGARMQEGLLSLMQMARTGAIIERLKQAGVPYLVVLTEPKAMIGFAGKRVIEQTVRETLEEPFQRAEFLLEHGVIDQVVHRHQLIDTIHRILAKLTRVNL